MILKHMIKSISLLSIASILSGCDYTLFNSNGHLGTEQGKLIILGFVLMLIVVIPVLFMSVWFPYHYRKSNTKTEYRPKWSHSTPIEIIVWVIPLLIILVLGKVTYDTSYSMDPRQSLVDKFDNTSKKELVIQAVSMDWKWVFFYPEQNIATVNEIAIPVNTPIKFLVTSDTVMNSFFIPAIGSQIYAMAGMENRLHLMSKDIGVFRGISANYSGFGFSGMRFSVHSLSNKNFTAWVKKVKSSNRIFNNAEYRRLTTKTKDHPVEYFSGIKNPDQFNSMIRKYLNTGSPKVDNANAPMKHGNTKKHSTDKEHGNTKKHGNAKKHLDIKK